MYKKRHNDEEISYWLSFSDMMAGLLIIFILVTVVMILNLNISTDASKAEKADYELMQQELEATKNELENLTSINDKIIIMLKNELGDAVEIDEDTGAISLKSDLLFSSGKSDLKYEGKVFIRENMPKFFEVLLSDQEIKENINAIVIHGFTDDLGDYNVGLRLSQDRARNVFEFILTDPEFSAYTEDLKNLVVLSGVSEARMLEQLPGESMNAWRARNRRVEFQFQLKFREIFETIKDHLES